MGIVIGIILFLIVIELLRDNDDDNSGLFTKPSNNPSLKINNSQELSLI